MKKIWLVIFAFAALSSCKREISEFQSQNFIKYFGNGLGANGFDVQELSDGYILAGYDNTSLFKKQIFVIRTNKFGNVVWQRQYGGENDEEGRTVKQIGDYFYISGVTTVTATGIINSFILKISSQGDSISYLRIGTDDYSLIINDFIVDDSYMYVAGESNQSSAVYSDFFVAKYSIAGDPVWSRTYIAPYDQSFSKIVQDQDGSFTYIGTTSDIGSNLLRISFGKLNSNGNPLGFTNLSTESNQLFSDALILDNEIIVTYNQTVQGSDAGRVVNVSRSDFSENWHVESGLDCQITSLAQSSDGTITVCGELNNTIHLYQLSSSGSITLVSNDLKKLSGYAEGLITTSDNGFLIVGTTAPDYGTMVQLIKTDADLFLFNQ